MKLQFHLLVAVCLFLPLHIWHIIASLDSDRQALLEFAAAVPHSRKLNWNSAVSICTSWIGITCDENKTRVTELRLPGFGLYGPIPTNSIGNLDALTVLSLRSNHLTGNLPSDVLSIPSLQSLYLQHNKFDGSIPTSLSPHLSMLDLSFNSLTGMIPLIINSLTQLTMLNLEFNSFSGAIPDINSPRLKLLNFSYNMLNGSIPHPLQKFPVSSFVGNSHLCGLPLTPCSLIPISPSPSPTYAGTTPVVAWKQIVGNAKRLSAGAVVAIVVGALSVVFLSILMVIFCCLKKRGSGNNGVVLKAKDSNGGRCNKPEDFGSGVQEAEKNKLVFFEWSSYNFDLEDLLRASAEVLGKGSYGTAYKAILDEATTVVVKRLRDIGVGKREFEQHMELLRRVGPHPNVVPLRAYYYSKDEKLLVNEYMPAGSLSSYLHDNRGTGRTPLEWDARVKILLGAAKGIIHIHSKGGVKFTHGNIKSSNVLLTRDFDGCISDFGLAPITNFLPNKTRAAGYLAPEVIETRKISQKSDVYSYGVLLLEMLTGKAPLPPSGSDDVVDLPRWVRSVVREEWTSEVFDAELIQYHNVEEEMVQMLQIALACVAKLPDMRPSMDEVVRMIQEIRLPELENRPSSEDKSNNYNVQTP